mmetsp:Transcript_23532/g.39972  ORF Transcript_23532/g.39972 Transcript_23532/m.39972 type:complete len:85 (-) Transcript_23532:428-682(-)
MLPCMIMAYDERKSGTVGSAEIGTSTSSDCPQIPVSSPSDGVRLQSGTSLSGKSMRELTEEAATSSTLRAGLWSLLEEVVLWVG